jgi:hypothetical protein
MLYVRAGVLSWIKRAPEESYHYALAFILFYPRVNVTRREPRFFRMRTPLHQGLEALGGIASVEIRRLRLWCPNEQARALD